MEYSAAVFRKKAARLIKSIIKREKVPIVSGGSGLYVKALVDGLFPSPQADIKFREKMRKFASRYGREKLHARLSRIDPESAGAIHPNDERRIIRALEIYDSTGHTMTELKSRTKGLQDLYDIRVFGLTAPRQDLYSRIDSRVDRMFAGGVVDEVKRLRKKRLSKTARSVLGLKEISGYLDGEYDLETAKALMKMNTRKFAKRQLTWFRADSRIRWYDVERMDEAEILKRISRVGKSAGRQVGR
jgi:tRNA dimethylallyltransferase